MRVSIIIPVFRNAGSILTTCSAINTQLCKAYPDYEIIVVDDGSDDQSREEILRSAQEIPEIQAVFLKDNTGQVNAIREGFRVCSGDVGVAVSADGQEPVELISAMLESWKKGALLVVGARSGRAEHWSRKVGSDLFYRLMRAFIPGIPKGGFDCFALDRSLMDNFIGIHGTEFFMQGELLRLEPSPAVVFYDRLARSAGKSQWTLRKKLKYVQRAIGFVIKKLT